MGRHKHQIFSAFIRFRIGHRLLEQLRVQKKTVIDAVVEGLLFSAAVQRNHVDAADIGIHALDVLQEISHVALPVLLHGIRLIALSVQNLPEMVERQITALRITVIEIIIIGHFGYGVIRIQHRLNAVFHIARRLLVLPSERQGIILNHLIGDKGCQHCHR